MDDQRMPTLGGLQGNDFRPPHRPQQVPWVTAIRGDRDLDETARKVCGSSDRGRGQGCLIDGVTLQGFGSQDRGGYSRGAAPVAAALLGGGLGVPLH